MISRETVDTIITMRPLESHFAAFDADWDRSLHFSQFLAFPEISHMFVHSGHHSFTGTALSSSIRYESLLAKGQLQSSDKGLPCRCRPRHWT